MLTNSIACLAAGILALGQAPPPSGADRTFYFGHASAAQSIQEIATGLRIIAEAQASADEAKKSLAVRGTGDQLQMAEWLFTGLDVASPAPASPAIYERRAPGGSDNVVRLFYLNRNHTTLDFQELATLARTIGDIRRVYA